MDTSAPPMFCLRTYRGHNSHSSEMSVCRALRPHPQVNSTDFSHTYLPVKSSIPLTTGQWLYQQTASGVFSTCFLQGFYGLLYWSISVHQFFFFFNVMVPLIVTRLFYFSRFFVFFSRRLFCVNIVKLK